MDFVADTLSSGRRFRCLTILDKFNRESLRIPVGHSIPAAGHNHHRQRLGVAEPRVRRLGLCPQGPAHLIQPGKPVQNCFIESFNGTFRDNCLNMHWFTSLEEMRSGPTALWDG